MTFIHQVDLETYIFLLYFVIEKSYTEWFFFILGTDFCHIWRIAHLLRYIVLVSKKPGVPNIEKNTLYITFDYMSQAGN